MKHKVYIIIGSTRPGRVGKAVAEWLYIHAKKQKDLEFEVIDLLDWQLPMLNEPLPSKYSAAYVHPHTRKWSEKISQASGFIFVTPEYNFGYPASLKNALDYLYHEWENKPAAFVSYGWGGGLKAVKQLREVAESLHMKQLVNQVSLPFSPHMFQDGALKDPETDFADFVPAIDALTNELAQTVEMDQKYQ